MLLHPDPQTYLPLLGIKSRTGFFLGPRTSGVGGNEAIYKAMQKLSRKDWRSLDQTWKKVISYLHAGGNPKFGELAFPGDWQQFENGLIQELPENLDELWTVSLSSVEVSSNWVVPKHLDGFQLTRMKMWCPYLSSETIWREEMRRGNSWKFYIELIGMLEFSEAESIQSALSQLEIATTEQQTQYPMYILNASALLFIAACADADLDFAGGNSVFEWFLPQVEEGIIVPPLRRWMKYAQQILGVDTQQEATNILLGYQSGGASREREGKRLWAYGGEYQPDKSKSKKLQKDLPSNNQFTKMVKSAMEFVEKNKPENIQYANDLKTCSAFVTFLSNLYDMLAELKSNEERMLLFNDYPYFYQVAKNTKGPPPRALGGG